MPRDVPVADVPASLGNIQLNVLQINPCMFLYRKVRIKTKQRILLSPAAGYCCSPSTSGLKHHHAFHFEFEFYLTVLLKHIFYKIPSLYMLFTVLQDEHCLRKNDLLRKRKQFCLTCQLLPFATGSTEVWLNPAPGSYLYITLLYSLNNSK